MPEISVSSSSKEQVDLKVLMEIDKKLKPTGQSAKQDPACRIIHEVYILW